MNQRRHRYLENGQLEIIGGGGVVVREGTSSEGGGQAVEERGRLQEGTRGVSHCRLAIYIKKYLKAKEEFHQAKI